LRTWRRSSQDLTDAQEGWNSRNRRNEMSKDSFFFIAAEESLTPEMVSEIKGKIQEMENA
jgi:hypothetical protein